MKNTDPWQQVYAETKKIHSWPYWVVWDSSRLRVFALVGTLALLGLLAVFLVSINPRLPGNWGWNTIDHIEDRRPLHDYASGGITAMAGSQDWLALGSERDGLVLINKDSRVPRDGIINGPVTDITKGSQEGSFLVLEKSQEIVNVTLSGISGLPPSQDIWLPQPVFPGWKSEGQLAPERVSVNSLDEHGWLMAVKGLGIARYLFEKLPDGRLSRVRSWQQTPGVSDVPLERALLTEKGIWLTLASGAIRFAETSSLQLNPGRNLTTTGILRFDADYAGSWASTLATNKDFWLLPPNGKGWSGPWFGTSPGESQGLSSTGSVKLARLDGGVAWLGTDNGFYAYDLGRHRMYDVIPKLNVTAIEPISPSSATTGTKSVLVAGDKGLFRVTGPDPAISTGFKVTQIVAKPINSLSLSPDATFLVFGTGTQKSPPEDIRVLANPSAQENSGIVSPASTWRKLTAAPQVIGIAPLGQAFVFGTKSGCFVYDPGISKYDDCSTAVAGKDGKALNLGAFSALIHGENRIVAIADGYPLVLQDKDSKRWTNLDPSRQTKPREIVEAGKQIVGLGSEGEIIQYDPQSLAIKLQGDGKANSLNGASASNTFVGDLSGSGDNWNVAFINGGHFITYDAASGHIAEKNLPSGLGRSQPVSQVRLLGPQSSYLLSDGEIWESEHWNKIFGSGSLPFRPDEVKSLAPSVDGHSVLVGGPDGKVSKYTWSSGSWTALPSLPVSGPESSIAELQDTTSGTWARISSGRIYFLSQGSWTAVDGYSQWAAKNNTSDVWAVGENGVAHLSPKASQLPKNWNASWFDSGTGMRDFVERAIFAWQMDKDRVAFFDKDGKIGLFDATKDSWDVRSSNRLHAPSQFTTGPDYLLAVDGSNLLRFTPKLEIQNIASLTGTVAHVTIRQGGEKKGALDRLGCILGGCPPPLDEKSLQLAYVDGKDVVLRVWLDASRSDFREYRLADFEARDISFSGDGKLWAMREDNLTRLGIVGNDKLAPVGATIDVSPEAATLRDALNEPDLKRLGLEADSAPKTLASIGFRDAAIDWVAERGGRIDTTWRSLPREAGDLPVWGSCGRLAIQCVKDIALTEQGELLLASEAGLLTRDAVTYQLKQIDFRSRGLSLTSRRTIGDVTSGPWRWLLNGNSLNVSHQSDHHNRGWTATLEGQKFSDDVVEWLARQGPVGPLSLLTRDGTWTYEAGKGRTGTGSPAAVRSPETMAEGNRAMTLTYADGRLTFRPFDGRAPFEQGRFFYDNSSAIAGSPESLFTLVPGRAVFRRDPDNPSKIMETWSLPAGLPAEVSYSLENTVDRLLLRPASSASNALTFEHPLSAGNQPWKETGSERTVAVVQPVTWRSGITGNTGIVPYLTLDQAAPMPLNEWWRGDRFLWDFVSAAGALNGNLVLETTPLGLIARKASAQDQYPIIQVWAIPGLDYIATRREGPKIGGLIVGRSKDGTKYLAQTDSTGQVGIAPAPTDVLLEQNASLVLEYQVDDQGEQYVGLGEEWSVQPTAARDVLRSQIANLPSSGMLSAGQFLFDRPMSAAPILANDPSKGNRWLVVLNCSADASKDCLLGTYQTEQGRIILRDLAPAPGNLEALRTSSSGTLYGLLTREKSQNSEPSLLRANWQESGLSWEPVTAEATEGAFREGDNIVLDHVTPSWTATPRNMWETEKPLTVVPNASSPFFNRNGATMLSFDVITSLSMGKSGIDLAIGTRGGVYSCNYGANEKLTGLTYLAQQGKRRYVSQCTPTSQADLITNVERLRRDQNGTLWAKTGPDGRTVELDPSGRWETRDLGWPLLSARLDDHSVSFSERGLMLDGKQYSESNDAWGLGTRSLQDVVDFVFDDQSQTLWISTQKNGLFKILMDKLP